MSAKGKSKQLVFFIHFEKPQCGMPFGLEIGLELAVHKLITNTHIIEVLPLLEAELKLTNTANPKP